MKGNFRFAELFFKNLRMKKKCGVKKCECTRVGEKKIHLQPAVQKKRKEEDERERNTCKNRYCERVNFVHVTEFVIRKRKRENRHDGKRNDKARECRIAA